MPAGQGVALEPAVAVVLGQHLHHPPVAGRSRRRRRSTRSAKARSETSKTAPSRLLLVSSGQNSRNRSGLRAVDVAHQLAELARRLRARRRRAGRRRGRSRGSRAGRGRGSAGRRWRAASRSSAGRPSGLARRTSSVGCAGRRRRAPPDGRSAASPRASRRCSGLSLDPGQRHLVRAPGAGDLDAVDVVRAGPALRACAARSSASAAGARPSRRRGPPPGSRGCAPTPRPARRRSGGACPAGRRPRPRSPRSRGPRSSARTSAGSLRASTVGPAILAPLRCRIGSTAPSRAGLRNEMPFHDPSSGPVSASPSPTTASASRSGLSITAPKACTST